MRSGGMITCCVVLKFFGCMSSGMNVCCCSAENVAAPAPPTPPPPHPSGTVACSTEACGMVVCSLEGFAEEDDDRSFCQQAVLHVACRRQLTLLTGSFLYCLQKTDHFVNRQCYVLCLQKTDHFVNRQ